MSTRASAPRCASCGMPLAPDAESCAVCGARVPLIARPASAEDDAPADDASSRAGDLASWDTAAGGTSAGAAPTVPGVPASSGGSAGAASHAVVATSSTGPAVGSPATRAAAFDAAAAARDVRAAARPARPQPARPTAGAPPIGTRVLAYAIDVLAAALVAGIGLVVVRVTDGEAAFLPGLLGLLVGIGQVVAEGLTGATLGAYLLGLRTVDERTGSTPGVPRAFVRQLVVGLGTLACLVGNWVVAASGAWDSGPRRRGWHDKASGTAVVRAGAATAPVERPSRAATTGAATAPWTPTPPPSPVAAPAPEARLDDFLFAPPPGVSTSTSAPAADPAPGPDLLTAPPAAPEQRPAPVAHEADLLPGPPAGGRRERAASRSAVPVGDTVRPPAVDDDLAELEHTRVRDPESLRRRTGTLALHFDTGERVRVVGRGLVGRGPRAEDGQDILHVVVLNDAARSLSRVHAEFGPQAASPGEDVAIWVCDRGSTNGTVVIDPAGTARVLPAGARALVGAGWTVRLGDREARVEDD